MLDHDNRLETRAAQREYACHKSRVARRALKREVEAVTSEHVDRPRQIAPSVAFEKDWCVEIKDCPNDQAEQVNGG